MKAKLTQMENIVLVHVLDGLADLSHVVDNLCLGHSIPFGRNPFKQLSTRQELIDQHHLIIILKRVMQVNELGVMQLVHDINLLLDKFLLNRVTDRDEFGGEDVSRLDLPTAVHHAEGPRADLLQNLVMVIDAVVLDVDGLRYELGVDVEHELVVVVRMLGAATDFLAGLIHCWVERDA